MGYIFDMLICQPLAAVLQFIYGIFHNYGLSIILFTVIVRLLILPLTLKQQKSTLEMQKIKPLMDEINKKYKNDKQKQQQEIMKLYQEHGVNPMAGCFPLLIQLPIIWGLYQVITRPLYFIMKLPEVQIREYFVKIAEDTSRLVEKMHFDQQHIDAFVNSVHSGGWVNNGEIIAAKVYDLINFNLLGIDLSSTPKFDMSHLSTSIDVLWIIPILAAGTTYLSTKMMSSMTASQGNEQAQQMNSTMSVMMPLMTLWFSFMMPLGVALYWLVNNLIQMGQQYALNAYFLPKMREGVESGNGKKGRKNGKDN